MTPGGGALFSRPQTHPPTITPPPQRLGGNHPPTCPKSNQNQPKTVKKFPSPWSHAIRRWESLPGNDLKHVKYIENICNFAKYWNAMSSQQCQQVNTCCAESGWAEAKAGCKAPRVPNVPEDDVIALPGPGRKLRVARLSVALRDGGKRVLYDDVSACASPCH